MIINTGIRINVNVFAINNKSVNLIINGMQINVNAFVKNMIVTLINIGMIISVNVYVINRIVVLIIYGIMMYANVFVIKLHNALKVGISMPMHVNARKIYQYNHAQYT
jgi:hypothetical protein